MDAIGKVAFQRNTQKVTCWPVCAATRLIQVSTIVCPSVAADLAWSVKSAGCPRKLLIPGINPCVLLAAFFPLHVLEWFKSYEVPVSVLSSQKLRSFGTLLHMGLTFTNQKLKSFFFHISCVCYCRADGE